MNSVKRNASLIIGGILVGLLLLQPFALFIFWLQFRKALGHELTDWLLDNLDDTLTRQGLFQADLAYMAFGIFITLTINYFSQKQNARKKEVQALENHIAASLPNLIKKGESENLEFKSSLRWDLRQEKINKRLETVIIKAISGFLNNQGGTLLVGVDDSGQILGLKNDYNSLKKKNADGFQLAIMDLVTKKLGGDITPQVTCIIHQIEKKDVAQIICQPAPRPVYLKDGEKTDFFLRSGCSTRALSIDEAIFYIKTRWQN